MELIFLLFTLLDSGTSSVTVPDLDLPRVVERLPHTRAVKDVREGVEEQSVDRTGE